MNIRSSCPLLLTSPLLLLCLVSTSQAFFDPNIGRWASRDPIEEEGGMNVYSVLGNNAVNLCDYLGLAPKLSYKTVDGPTGKDCGEFNWSIQWLLDAASTKGGYIVQNVAVTFDVKHCGGAPFDVKKVMGYDPAWWPLWELWPVNAGKDRTTYAVKGLAFDDIYSFKNFGSCTYGTVTISGKAEFYDGLSLPSGFKVTKKPPTGILMASQKNPNLTGGSGPLDHSLTATWDCCSGNGKTVLTTK